MTRKGFICLKINMIIMKSLQNSFLDSNSKVKLLGVSSSIYDDKLHYQDSLYYMNRDNQFILSRIYYTDKDQNNNRIEELNKADGVKWIHNKLSTDAKKIAFEWINEG